MSRLAEEMTKLHDNPLKPKDGGYEQRVLGVDRKWRQDFGRKIKGDMVLKDYTKDRMFANPL